VRKRALRRLEPDDTERVTSGSEGGLVGSNAHPATQLIDFVALLMGYAISGERTLEAF
jgi:hypothetical protein